MAPFGTSNTSSWSNALSSILRPARNSTFSNPPLFRHPPGDMWRDIISLCVYSDLADSGNYVARNKRRFVRIEHIGLSAVVFYEIPTSQDHTSDTNRSLNMTMETIFGDSNDPNMPGMFIDDLLDWIDSHIVYFPSYSCTSFAMGQAMQAFLLNRPEMQPYPAREGFSVDSKAYNVKLDLESAILVNSVQGKPFVRKTAPSSLFSRSVLDYPSPLAPISWQETAMWSAYHISEDSDEIIMSTSSPLKILNVKSEPAKEIKAHILHKVLKPAIRSQEEREGNYLGPIDVSSDCNAVEPHYRQGFLDNISATLPVKNPAGTLIQTSLPLSDFCSSIPCDIDDIFVAGCFPSASSLVHLNVNRPDELLSLDDDHSYCALFTRRSVLTAPAEHSDEESNGEGEGNISVSTLDSMGPRTPRMSFSENDAHPTASSLAVDSEKLPYLALGSFLDLSEHEDQVGGIFERNISSSVSMRFAAEKLEAEPSGRSSLTTRMAYRLLEDPCA